MSKRGIEACVSSKETCMARDEERAGRRETDREDHHGREDLHDGENLREEEELRVQRTEEELRAGTRAREAGQVRLNKRVRPAGEQERAPPRHEEVSVERV